MAQYTSIINAGINHTFNSELYKVWSSDFSQAQKKTKQKPNNFMMYAVMYNHANIMISISSEEK